MNLLTIQQAAAQLGLKPRRLQQLCANGDIKHERVGRMIFIAPRDLVKPPDRRGRKLKCTCGTCGTCQMREYKRRSRERHGGSAE